MDISKINKCIDHIIVHDAYRMHYGSVKCLELIKNEVDKSNRVQPEVKPANGGQLLIDAFEEAINNINSEEYSRKDLFNEHTKEHLAFIEGMFWVGRRLHEAILRINPDYQLPFEDSRLSV